MSGRHEPREEFVTQLERQLREGLRQSQVSGAPSWLPQSKMAVALASAALVIVSMAIGGGVVATAYESRLNEQRDVLVTSFEQRVALAKQRLELAKRQLADAERRVSVGIEKQDVVADVRVKVVEAEAEMRSIELDIMEIRATDREPMHTVSAPLVSGRDFVTERWKVEMAVPMAARDVEKARAQAAQTRVDVGIASPDEVTAAATTVIELESALAVFQRKMEIRQAFLKGSLTAAVADLRALEAENELRRTGLARRVDLARRQVQTLKGRVDIGTANPLELAGAELRLQELQLEMSKADYELALIRKQLGK
jgi:outer membrane protein TolC